MSTRPPAVSAGRRARRSRSAHLRARRVEARRPTGDRASSPAPRSSSGSRPGEQSVIAVVAPAGYGKTTLLAQWAERKHPRVAWLSVDDRDNDPRCCSPTSPWRWTASSRSSPACFGSLASPGAGMADVARLVCSIAAMDAPVALVHRPRRGARRTASAATWSPSWPCDCRRARSWRSDRATSCRCRSPRLRAEGGIVEVGVDDLAMDAREAGSLLRAARVSSSDAGGRGPRRPDRGLAGRLYLAALAMNAGSSHRATCGDRSPATTGSWATTCARSSSTGSRRPTSTFLTRTSILDRLCGPLCDVTRRRDGSGASPRAAGAPQPAGWSRSTVGASGTATTTCSASCCTPSWSGGSRRSSPSSTPGPPRGTRRTAMPEAAIDHAQHAGDADRVARLVLQLANPVWASGRLDTVLRWMEWFSANGLDRAAPGHRRARRVDLRARSGDAGDAERWAAAAERTTFAGTLPDGNTMEGTFAYLRALAVPRRASTTMRRDAAAGAGRAQPDQPVPAGDAARRGLRPHLLEGDLERADAVLRPRRRRGDQRRRRPVRRARARRARHRRHRTGRLVGGRRRSPPRRWRSWATGQFDDYWTSALVYAWAARVAAHRGDVAAARDLVRRAARLRPLLTYALPVVSVQALLEMARAYIALADPAARTRSCGRSTTSTSTGADLGHAHRAGRRAARPARSDQGRDARGCRRSRRPSCGCCRCCRPTSRWPRSASGCSSPATRSRPRRSRSTASSACRPASETIDRMQQLGLAPSP